MKITSILLLAGTASALNSTTNSTLARSPLQLFSTDCWRFTFWDLDFVPCNSNKTLSAAGFFDHFGQSFKSVGSDLPKTAQSIWNTIKPGL